MYKVPIITQKKEISLNPAAFLIECHSISYGIKKLKSLKLPKISLRRFEKNWAYKRNLTVAKKQNLITIIVLCKQNVDMAIFFQIWVFHNKTDFLLNS